MAQNPITPATKNITARPQPGSLPTTLVRSFLIDNIHTDLLLQLFSDQILIIVTQLSGRPGTILRCTVEDSPMDEKKMFHIDALLGKRDDSLLEVYVRRITERIVQLSEDRVCPPIVLGMALKGDSGKEPASFTKIVDTVLNIYGEGIGVASSL